MCYQQKRILVAMFHTKCGVRYQISTDEVIYFGNKASARKKPNLYPIDKQLKSAAAHKVVL